MNDNQIRSTDMVEVTDCLEAIGVFRIWKNLFAVLLIVGLIVVQVGFWCIHQGWYEVKAPQTGTDPNASSTVIQPEKPQSTPKVQPIQKAQQTQETQGKQTSQPPQPAQPPEPLQTTPPTSASQPSQPTQEAQAPAVQEVNIPGRTAPKAKLWYAMTRDQIGRAIDITDGILLFSAFMYTLTLVFAMKVSILGRFGGINHICRAFYNSLILLILLIPWQEILKGYLVGAMYSYQDIQTGLAHMGMIPLYLRFTMLWLFVFLLLIQTQSRTIRWAKSILRRLEIL